MFKRHAGKYADTKMKEHPAVAVRRQAPRALTLTRLTESHPFGGDMTIFPFIPEQEKKRSLAALPLQNVINSPKGVLT